MKIKSNVVTMTTRPYKNVYTSILSDLIEYHSSHCFPPSATVSLKFELTRHSSTSGSWPMLFNLSQRFLYQKPTSLNLSLYSGLYLNVTLQTGSLYSPSLFSYFSFLQNTYKLYISEGLDF